MSRSAGSGAAASAKHHESTETDIRLEMALGSVDDLSMYEADIRAARGKDRK